MTSCVIVNPRGGARVRRRREQVDRDVRRVGAVYVRDDQRVEQVGFSAASGVAHDLRGTRAREPDHRIADVHAARRCKIRVCHFLLL